MVQKTDLEALPRPRLRRRAAPPRTATTPTTGCRTFPSTTFPRLLRRLRRGLVSIRTTTIQISLDRHVHGCGARAYKYCTYLPTLFLLQDVSIPATLLPHGPFSFGHWAKHLMQSHTSVAFTVYFTVMFLLANVIIITVTRWIYGPESVNLGAFFEGGAANSTSVDAALGNADRLFRMIEDFTDNFLGEEDKEKEETKSSFASTTEPPLTAPPPYYTPDTTTEKLNLLPRERKVEDSGLRDSDAVKEDEIMDMDKLLQGLVHDQKQLARMTTAEKLRLMSILEEQKRRLMGYTTKSMSTTTTTTSRPKTTRARGLEPILQPLRTFSTANEYADLNDFYKKLTAESSSLDSVQVSGRGMGSASSGGEEVLSRSKRQLPVFGFLSFLMLLLNSVLLVVENINVNNNNNNNNNNDNNNNNNNLNNNQNGRALLEMFEELASTVMSSLTETEDEEEKYNLVERNKSFNGIDNSVYATEGSKDDVPQFFYPGMEDMSMYQDPYELYKTTTTTTGATSGSTSTKSTTTTSTTTTRPRTAFVMDPDVVPMAMQRKRKRPDKESGDANRKPTIIFASTPPESPKSDSARRYRFSVESGTVIAPNVVPDATSGEFIKYRPVGVPASMTTTTTTQGPRSTSTMRPITLTARPKFTLIVKEPNGAKSVASPAAKMVRGVVPDAMERVKRKRNRVTKVSELKKVLGVNDGEKKELWELLGRRRREAQREEFYGQES